MKLVSSRFSGRRDVGTPTSSNLHVLTASPGYRTALTESFEDLGQSAVALVESPKECCRGWCGFILVRRLTRSSSGQSQTTEHHGLLRYRFVEIQIPPLAYSGPPCHVERIVISIALQDGVSSEWQDSEGHCCYRRPTITYHSTTRLQIDSGQAHFGPCQSGGYICLLEHGGRCRLGNALARHHMPGNRACWGGVDSNTVRSIIMEDRAALSHTALPQPELSSHDDLGILGLNGRCSFVPAEEVGE